MTARPASTRHIPRRLRGATAACLLLLPLFFVTAAADGALTPMASGEKVVFFDDFSSGALDPDRWALPTGWGLEKARMKPWDYPLLPVEESTQPHLSDSTISGGSGRYHDSNRTWIETNWVDLTQAAGSARMSLYHRFDIDASEDGALVMARTELRGWALLTPQSGYPTTSGFAGSALVYAVSNFDISAYAGSRVKVAFEIYAGDNGVAGDGWHIQSLALSYTTAVDLPNIQAVGLDILNSGGSKITVGTAGDVLELKVRLLNSGTANPARPMPVQFWDGLAGQGRLIGQTQVAPIGGGSSGNATIRAVLAAGTHEITAVVDPSGVVEELSTTDNTARASVLLDPPAGVDFAVIDMWFESGGTRTTGARPGQQVDVNITLANVGATDFSGGFIVALSRRNADNSTTVLQNQTVLGLVSGEVAPVKISFSAVAGNLTLVVSADKDDVVAEAREANNFAERPLVVSNSPPVDLSMESIQLLSRGVEVSSAAEGELIQIVARVRNIGAGPLSDTFSVSIYVGDPDTAGLLVFTRAVPSGLVANATVEVRGTWVALIGVRALYAYVDMSHEIFEANEQNNKVLDTITVLPDARANLVVTQVRFSVFGHEVNTTQVGAPVNVTITIMNAGVSTQVGGFLSSTRENPWIAAGTTPFVRVALPDQIARNGVVEVSYPWTATGGTSVFIIVADYQLAVDETNEFDNIAARSLVVTTDSPDLVPGSVSVKSRNVEVGTLYPQLKVTIRAEVTNSGITAVASPFVIELWAGEPGSLGALRLTTKTVEPPFHPSDTVAIEAQWNASFPESGTHEIVVLADPSRTIVELDWVNNRASKEVNYVSNRLPNLHLGQVSALTQGGATLSQAREGEEIRVDLEVLNDSPVPFLGGSSVEVRDGTQVVFNAPLPRMDPQELIVFSFNWTARAGAQLQVVLNGAAQVQESDYTDNNANVAITVTAAAQTPYALYAGAGAGAAAAVGLLLFVVARRRRAAVPAPPTEVPPAGPEQASVPPPEPGAPDEGAAAPPAEAPAAPADAPLPPAEGEPAPPAATAGLCPQCSQPVEAEWTLCPNCETPLR